MISAYIEVKRRKGRDEKNILRRLDNIRAIVRPASPATYRAPPQVNKSCTDSRSREVCMTHSSLRDIKPAYPLQTPLKDVSIDMPVPKPSKGSRSFPSSKTRQLPASTTQSILLSLPSLHSDRRYLTHCQSISSPLDRHTPQLDGVPHQALTPLLPLHDR